MNLDVVTVQDCIEMYSMKGCVTVIENGKVTGFEKETQEISMEQE